MEILINQNNASEHSVELNKFRWKLYAQKVKLSILGLFICGLIFFISGLSSGYDSSSSESTYTESTGVTYVRTVQNEYHFMTGLGASFILFSLYLVYYYLISQKKQYFNSVYRTAARRKSKSDKMLIKITEDSIYHEDFEAKVEEKWSAFSEYKNFNDYLLLIRSNEFDSVLIDKRAISNSDLGELLRFVRNKLIEKKSDYFGLAVSEKKV